MVMILNFQAQIFSPWLLLEYGESMHHSLRWKEVCSAILEQHIGPLCNQFDIPLIVFEKKTILSCYRDCCWAVLSLQRVVLSQLRAVCNSWEMG